MRPIAPFDPSTATSGAIPGATLPNGGAVVIINKSAYELWLSFDSRDVMDVPAWTARLYKTCERVAQVTWAYANGWTPSGQTSGAPSSLVSLELYGPQEQVPENYPVALTRLVSVGNQVSTSSGASMKNDGNAPGTSIVEATPSDQASSAIQEYNDGSGYRKVLSAGSQRTLLNVVRGNATTGKAVIDLGDAGDLTITTYHGQFDAACSFPVTQIGAGTLPAGVSVPTSRLAAGALPAGVTLPASQLSAGTAPTGVDLTSVNSDGGTLTSDGAGTLTAAPTPNATNKGLVVGSKGSCFQTDQNGSLELGAGNLINPGTAQTPYIDFHTSANALDYDARIVASGGSASMGNGVLTMIGQYFGWKNGANTKMAEIKMNHFVLAPNSYFETAGGTYTYDATGSFDSFDVSEAYATDADYPAGTLLCPGPAGVLTRCTHDGCHAALIVSEHGGLALGMGEMEEGEPLPANVRPMALAGRVRALASGGLIAARALLTSDGAGGVRAMRPGEAGFAVGFALHDAVDGRVGVMVRPMWCIAPAAK